MEKFEHTAITREMWYPSALDLLDLDDVPAYGGMTNRALLEGQGLTAEEIEASVRQSYVIRAKLSPELQERFVAEDHDPDPANSWFPPFEWTSLFCKSCDESLGWLFTPPATASQPVEEPFIALRVTSLREGIPEAAGGAAARRRRGRNRRRR